MIDDYGKEGGYRLIIGANGMGSVLYNDDYYDCTKEVVDFVASGICIVKNYGVDSFHLSMLDENVALLTYHASQQTLCGSNYAPTPVWVSSVYVRRENSWLNIIYQQTKADQ